MNPYLDEEETPTRWHAVAAAVILATLIAGPIVLMSTVAKPQVSQTQPSVDLDDPDVGNFAFGYVEFDWDPRNPAGAPGFDPWRYRLPPR